MHFYSAQKYFYWMSLSVFCSPLSAKPFDPTFLLSCTVSNIISCMVFSERFSYDDKQFLRLLDIINAVLKFNSELVGQVSRGHGLLK